jgi:hypothetical protein
LIEEATVNHYEQKQEARRARLEEAAERARAKASTEFRKADLREEVSGIPFGQPILVGHHSEGRHRRTIERAHNAMRRGVDAQKHAAELDRRADGVGRGGISSDDPDAVAKLREELLRLEARQEAIKARPHESWELSNNGANMRRIRDRIAQLERNATRETKETTPAPGVRIVQNAEANRLQIFFEGRPAAEIRDDLKAAGFRWAPSEGAWQRHLSTNAVWSAEYALRKLTKPEASP